MKIELAKPENSRQLAELVLAAAAELRGVDFTEGGWERFIAMNSATDFEQKLNDPEFLLLCCVESNHLLGFIALLEREKIDQLFVAPGARKRRVAAFLWQSAKKIALDAGASGEFWVRSSSLAIPVYKKFGFVCEGDRESFAGISFQLMRLQP